MRRLTVQEQVLIFAILAILMVGACVKHCRRRIVPEVLPELPPSSTVPKSESQFGEEPNEE